MEAAAEALRYVNLLILLSISLASARKWRAGARGAGWVALAFAALLAIFTLRLLSRSVGLEEVPLRVVAIIGALFPYLLFRFTASLRPAGRRVELLVGGLTAATGLAFMAPESLPFDEDPRPGWLTALIVALLIDWSLVLLVVSARLWKAGRGQASIARRRMRMLAFACPMLVLGIAVGALGPGERPPALDLGFRALVLFSALAFFVAFAPPRIVRTVWRRAEEDAVRRATQSLIGVNDRDDIITAVLEPMARLVGAESVAVLDADDHVLGTYGPMPANMSPGREAFPFGTLGAVPAGDPSGRTHPLRLPLVKGSVLVRVSPYAPVFGDEEFDLLKTLGAFAELALEHARLFAREREARLVLEQADELKSAFIALASHELRGPVATVRGLAELLDVSHDALAADDRVALRRGLREESERLAGLIVQLLDSSRLEAGAVEIKPQLLRIHDHVEDIVDRVAGDRHEDVEIRIPCDLEANVDPNALERILSNLVTNALRYAEPPISVSAVQRDGDLEMSVEDRGRGVPDELVPRLFERFTRANGPQPSGTGLGLSIAESYARAHGGQLLYRPGDPHGARFDLVLSRSKPSAGATCLPASQGGTAGH